MKKLFYLQFILALQIFFSLSPAAAAKFYRITDVNISAQLNKDGSMDVTESRTYQFKGSYRYAFRTFPLSDSISFTNFYVSEHGNPYNQSSSKEPGSFQIYQKENKIEVRWFYRASYETRTFDIRYTVKHLVQRYEDAAVLHYQFISKAWRKASRNIQIMVKPPVPLSKGQLNEWLHGPLWAKSEIGSDGTITARCEYLPKRSFLELRAIYPPDLFPDAQKKSGLVRTKIMNEEAQLAEEANLKREAALKKQQQKEKRRAFGKWFVMLVSLLGLWGWWLLFQKYGQRPRLHNSIPAMSEAPPPTKPALVGYLLQHREISGGALVSTLLDLAQKGYLALREKQEDHKRLFGGTRKKVDYIWELNLAVLQKAKQELIDWENDLLHFIFDELGEGRDSIRLKVIQKQQKYSASIFSNGKRKLKMTGKPKTGSI